MMKHRERDEARRYRMNRALIVTMLAIGMALPVFGSGVPDKPNPQEYEKYSTVTVLSRLPLPEPEFGLVTQQSPMKPGFKVGSPVPAQGKSVYPLLNLDVFLLVKGKPTQVVAEKAEKMNRAIIVVIPDFFIKRITDGALAHVTGLMFWDEPKRQWISFDEYVKDKEVSPLVAGPGYVSFEIYQWPVGDRLIGCW
jgi:hypothetical protein